MSIRLKFILLILIVGFLPIRVEADETVSVKLSYIILSPSGEFAAEVDGVGDRIDVEDDLNLDDSNSFTAEAALALGDFKLTASYLPTSFEGSSILKRNITFNGEEYVAGSRVNSSLDLDIWDLGLTYFFVNFDDFTTRVQLGVELAIKVTDAEASMTDTTFGISESASETLPIPTIGLRARFALSDFIGASGRLGYLGYGDNYLLDGDIQVEFSPLPLVGIYAGYRYIDVEIDESDLFVDTTFSGFYGGALVRF